MLGKDDPTGPSPSWANVPGQSPLPAAASSLPSFQHRAPGGSSAGPSALPAPRMLEETLGRVCKPRDLVFSLQLQQDGGRVEEYLQQSQPYLQDSQTVLRLEAVRFIGEPSPWVPLWAAFGSPRHCPGSEAQPCCPQSPPTGPLLQPPSGNDLAGVQEGAQPGWPGQGLRCWERAGERGSDGNSVSRACCALLQGPERGEAE